MATHEHPLLPSQEIFDEIRQLVAAKSTGTIFITSQDNHAVQIGLDNGDIIGCRYRFKRGKAALPLIAAMGAGRYSFDSTNYVGEDSSLPPTANLLHILEGGSGSQAMLVTSSTEKGGEEVATVLLQELALYLGPIASILIDDYLQDEGAIDTPDGLQRMIMTLADEIDEPGRKKEFLQRVQSKL